MLDGFRFRMKRHTIRCVFALSMHLNVCVFIQKRISEDATMEAGQLYDTEHDAGRWVGQNGKFSVT